MEELLNDSILHASQENNELKRQLNDLNKSLLLEIGAATQKFTSSNEDLKEELENFNNSIQSEIRSIEQQLTSANQKIEKDLQNYNNFHSFF